MLPDIDESAYDEWEKQQLAQRMEQKTSSFALEHALNSRISELSAFAAPSSSDSLTNPLGAGNAAPLPEPAAPEPAPPQPEESLPSPPPSPAPPTIAPPVQPAAAPPTTSAPTDLGSWVENSAGAVGRAGGDVGLYLNNLRTSGDLVGNAIGAANKAGADLQSFASSLAPPPAPPQRAQAPASSGGAGGGVSVGSVPGWLSDMISRNAPPELANDPEFIRTVAAGAKTESGWDVNRVQNGFAMGSGKGARGLFQFDMGGMGAGHDEQALLGQQGAEMQASKIIPLYAKAYASAPAGLSGAEKASWVAAQAERPAGYTDPTSAARRNYASSFSEIGDAIGGAASAVGGAIRQKVNDISQFGSGQLSSDEAYAACGPAAAVRFASMYGRNPTLREATDLASQVGWTSGSGMAGLSSEKALMDKLGVPTKMIAGAQWDQFAKEAQSGNPVTISTPGHYYFADGFDPTSGAFHVGRSGTDLKGGSEWMTPAQMETRMGKVQGGLLADNPQVPAPSIADRDSDPVSYLGRMKDTMGASITSGAPSPDLTDINGRLTSAATGTTYKAPLGLASGDLQAASVGEPTAIEAPASPVDKLKSAFGDFVDSLGGGAKSATDALGGAAGNLVAAPGGGLPAGSQPMPSDSLTNPLGAPREPTPDWVTNVGSAIAENQANPPLAGVREQIANAPVLGGALGMARGPMLLSDEEVLASPEADTARAILEQAARSSRAANPIVTDRDVAEAARGLMTGQAVAMTGEGFGNPRVRPDRMAPRLSEGAVPASGENMLGDALGRLDRYPAGVTAGIRGWALGEDAPASTIATVLRRWMEENPAAATESVSPAAVENIVGDLANEVRSGGRGAIGSPSAEMPGQLSLGDGFMRERPILPEGAENPDTGASPFESTSAAVGRARAQRGAQSAEVERARAESRARGEPDPNVVQESLPGVMPDSGVQRPLSGGTEGGTSPYAATEAAVEHGRAQRTAQEAEVARARAESRARGEPEPVIQGPIGSEFESTGSPRTQPFMPEGSEGGTSPYEATQEAVAAQRGRRSAQEAEVARAREESRARGEPEPDSAYTGSEMEGFRAPELKLPVYVNKEVRGLLEQGNQSVSHATAVGDDLLQGLAKKTGETAERIRKVWKPSEQNDAVLRSVNSALDESARKLTQAQEILRANPTSGDARADLVRQLTRHQALQETAGARRPEAAGVLTELKDTVAGNRAAGEQLEDMAKRAHAKSSDEYAKWLSEAKLVDRFGQPDAEAVGRMARVARDYTFADYATALWYFNLLSGPLTHVRNVVGGIATTATAPAEALGSAVFDPVARRWIGDKGPRQRYYGEAGHMVAGWKDAVQDNLLNTVTNALKYGNPSKSGELGRLTREPWSDVRIAGKPLEIGGHSVLGPLAYPGRALEAEDAIFSHINRHASIRGLAYREAAQSGKTGQALADEVASLKRSPSKEMLEEADKMAEYRGFRQADETTSGLNQAIKGAPLIKGVMPFVRVPVNIAKYTLERSPAGAAKILYDTAFGRSELKARGAGELADRMSRTTLGSTLMLGMYKYAEAGNLTGRAPADASERAQWEREGKTPYSFRTPLGWQSYDAIQPFASLIGTAADVADAVKRGQIKDEKDLGAIGTVSAMAMARGLSNTQWTQGLVDTLDLLQGQGPQNTDPGKAVTQLAGQMASNGVVGSGLLRTITRMTDDVIRNPADTGLEGIADQVKMNIPGLSGQVPEAIGAFGETRHRVSSGLSAAINPSPLSQPKNDPVEIELKRLQDQQVPGLPKRLGNYTVEPGFVGKNISVPLGGESIDVGLTEEQQRTYQRQTGQMSHGLISLLMGSDDWQKWSDDEKAAAIDDVYSEAGKMVREGMQPALEPQALKILGRGLVQRQRKTAGS